MKHENGIMEQTWWNENIQSTYNQFLGWVGDEKAESKIFFRKMILANNYKSILDVGCGPATEYYPLKEANKDIDYTGVDSCEFFVERNTKQGISMIKCSAHSIPLKDSSKELVFGRHILEHQPEFKPVMNEMIRVAAKAVAHIFFLKPTETLDISYDEKSNLYHNTYVKDEIDDFLENHQKVVSYEWFDINKQENMVLIELN